MARITVTTAPDGTPGERFDVAVEHAGADWAYTVTVGEELAARLGAEPPVVARATLAFLLDREPPAAILPVFDCEVVSRYFPDYEAGVRGYLDGPDAEARQRG